MIFSIFSVTPDGWNTTPITPYPTIHMNRWTAQDYCDFNGANPSPPGNKHWCIWNEEQQRYFYNYAEYSGDAFCYTLGNKPGQGQECQSYIGCKFHFAGTWTCSPQNDGYQVWGGDRFCAYSRTPYFCYYDENSGAWFYRGERDPGAFCQYMGHDGGDSCASYYTCKVQQKPGDYPSCVPNPNIVTTTTPTFSTSAPLTPPVQNLQLPRLNGNSPTTSGYSSGCYSSTLIMAIYSKTIKGIGCTGGGPGVQDDWALPMLHQEAAQGKIDHPDNMKDARVMIHHGSADQIVNIEQGYKMYAFYQSIMNDESQIKAVFDDVGHDYHSDKYSGWGVINQGYDFSKDLITHIYPDLDKNLQTAGASPNINEGKLKEFSQEEFCQEVADSCKDIHMASIGYYYAPEQCLGGGCKIHIAIHGCTLTHENPVIGTNYMRRIGMIEVADLYGIVVLFPHTKWERPVDNPYWGDGLQGCWNTFGYLNKYYYRSYENPQYKVFMKMIERLQEAV